MLIDLQGKAIHASVAPLIRMMFTHQTAPSVFSSKRCEATREPQSEGPTNKRGNLRTNRIQSRNDGRSIVGSKCQWTRFVRAGGFPTSETFG